MTDYALLVGINAYAYPNMLNGCINDIDDMQSFVVRSCGFDLGAIRQLADGAATATAIKAELKNRVQLLRAGDRFLFHYSGHGAQLQDGNPATDVICPVDFDFTAATAVTADDFHEIFKTIPAGVSAVWISDSCHSGDLEKDLYEKGVPRLFRPQTSSPRVFRGPAMRTFRSIVSELPQIALVAGCRSDQTSADANFGGRYNGALTYFLLNVLEEPGALRTPLTQLALRVQAALHDAGYRQVPQLTGTPEQTDNTFLQQGIRDKRRLLKQFAGALGLSYEEQASDVTLSGVLSSAAAGGCGSIMVRRPPVSE